MWDHVVPVTLGAFALMLIGFSQTAGDARAFAAKHRYQIDVNQESLAQSAANIGSGVFQGMPVSTSLSASSLNDHSGARTGPGVDHVRRHGPGDAAGPGAAVLRAAQAGARCADHRGRRDGHDERARDAPDLPRPAVRLLGRDRRDPGHARLRRPRRRHDRHRPVAALAGRGRHPAGHAASSAASRARRSTATSPRTRTTSDPTGVAVVRIDGGLFFATSDALEDRVRTLIQETPGIHGVVARSSRGSTSSTPRGPRSSTTCSCSARRPA